MLLEKKGKLIIIEGLDGSGKTTQTQLLANRLEKNDIPFQKVKFPNYEEDTSILARMYLNGDLGNVDDINAYAASSFYAADRYATWQKHWKTAYQQGVTFLIDRYTTSNMVHQTTKVPRENWDAFLDWLQDYEYDKLGMPKPDVVLYLDMHPNTSRRLLDIRYGNNPELRDIHEENLPYLLKCREAALYAAEKFGWNVLRCCDGHNPLPEEQIHNELWLLLRPYFQGMILK